MSLSVSERLDVAVAHALADPELEARTTADPGYADGLIGDAREIATAAFSDADERALDVAHRTLYAIYAQHAWSPACAMRDNQHDPTIAAVLRVLERGFDGWLSGFALPEEPPSDPDAFTAWLTDLALERTLPELPSTGMGAFVKNEISLDQLKEIVAQRSLFFLKEPDPWAMVIPSLHGEAKAGLLDLLLDEYGWGRYDQMHSTIYEDLMRALDLEAGYDAYADRTSWQFLSGMNLQNMYARHRKLCRRMYGYIYLVEADSPRAMKNYLGAWDRLGLGDDERVTKFYDLHITADEGHQEVALNEIILPVVKAEPQARADIARGVLEGRVTDELFANHLKASFGAGESSLCR